MHKAVRWQCPTFAQLAQWEVWTTSYACLFIRSGKKCLFPNRRHHNNNGCMEGDRLFNAAWVFVRKTMRPVFIRTIEPRSTMDRTVPWKGIVGKCVDSYIWLKTAILNEFNLSNESSLRSQLNIYVRSSVMSLDDVTQSAQNQGVQTRIRIRNSLITGSGSIGRTCGLSVSPPAGVFELLTSGTWIENNTPGQPCGFMGCEFESRAKSAALPDSICWDRTEGSWCTWPRRGSGGWDGCWPRRTQPASSTGTWAPLWRPATGPLWTSSASGKEQISKATTVAMATVVATGCYFLSCLCPAIFCSVFLEYDLTILTWKTKKPLLENK